MNIVEEKCFFQQIPCKKRGGVKKKSFKVNFTQNQNVRFSFKLKARKPILQK